FGEIFSPVLRLTSAKPRCRVLARRVQPQSRAFARSGTAQDIWGRRPMRNPSIIDGLLKSDCPRTIDRYIDYFGGDGLPSLGDLGGHDAQHDAVETEEQTS